VRQREAFGFMAVTNELLELEILKFDTEMQDNASTHDAWIFRCMLKITNMATDRI